MLRFAALIVGLVLPCISWGASPTPPPRIIIDGCFDDWESVPVAFTDPAGDQGRSAVDVRAVRLTSDERYLYLQVELGSPINLQNAPTPLRIHLDADRSANTGQRIAGMGSDLAILLPERRIVEQIAEAFEAAPIPRADLDLIWEPTLASRQFEMRLSREAVFPKRGGQIFSEPQFDMLIVGRPLDGEPEEWAPDGQKPFTWRFIEGTPPPWPTVPLARAAGNTIRLVSYNTLWDGLTARPEYFERILKALQPDIICLQEVRRPIELVRQRLNAMLPLPDSGEWSAHKQGFSVLASRWPIGRANFSTSFPTNNGQAMALIDLPDDRWTKDLYVISAHYRCCGQIGSHEDRQRQIQSDATVRWFKDLREPGGEITLPSGTPFVMCGDLNLVGGPQVLDTLLTGDIVDTAMFGPASAPDWDGSPLTDLRPLHAAAPLAYTWRDDSKGFPPGRLDAILYTDSAMRAARSFILDTAELPDADLKSAGLQRDDSAKASDHLPLVADFEIVASSATTTTPVASP
ncbi:MAG TPA: endonuclease/exonuclease/phosphatase family protein [Phycisphaerae bacterium]|nr:endonuclease/exonuclease/phosphatase family protein [Phycisphaerae bacterium]